MTRTEQDTLLERFSDTYFPDALDDPIWLPHRYGAILEFLHVFSIKDMKYALRHRVSKEILLGFNTALLEHGERTGDNLTLERYTLDIQGEKGIKNINRPETYEITEEHGLYTVRYTNKKYKAKFNEEKTDRIEWARWSWNPVTGCRFGCAFCYARDKAENPFFAKGFPVQFNPAFYPDRLDAPANTKNKPDYPNNVFVCSMADLFGDWVLAEWIDQILESVRNNPQWNYLFLTKNPKRYLNFEFPPNCWLGATADTQKRADSAIETFNQMNNHHVHFLSCEPLSEAVNIEKADNLQWVIIGGQSKIKGLSACQPEWEWVTSLVSTAQEKNIPLYFKPNFEIKGDMSIFKEMPA